MRFLTIFVIVLLLNLSFVVAVPNYFNNPIRTPEVDGQEVRVDSQQVFSNKYFSVYEGTNNQPNINPFIITPSDETIFFEEENYEFCHVEENQGLTRCLLNYKFTEVGVYRFGVIIDLGLPEEETRYDQIIYVEDRFGLELIKERIIYLTEIVNDLLRGTDNKPNDFYISEASFSPP